MDRNQQQHGQFDNRHGQQAGQPSQHGAQPSQHGTQPSQHGRQASGVQHLQSMAEVAVRGTALLWDLQMESARNMWRTQARTAAVLGIPDCSELFRVGDDRTRRIFSMGAEQMLSSARQARETLVEMQRQLGRIAEQQTIGIAEDVRDRIEQMGRHTEQGLQEINQMTAAEADHVEDLVHRSTNGNASVGAPNAETAEASNAHAAGEENGADEGRPQRETRRADERSRARR